MISNFQYLYIIFFVGTDLYSQLNRSEKNVRRNLNFTETPITIKKTQKSTKPKKSNLNKTQMNKGDLPIFMSSKKSFLVPPNTIKDLYTKNKSEQNRLSYLNQTRILITDSENKYHRLSEKSRSCSSLAENINPTMHQTNNKTSVIQHTSSWTLNVNDQCDVNRSLFFSCSDFPEINNELIGGEISNLNTSKSKLCNNKNNSNNITTSKASQQNVNNEQIRVDSKLANVHSFELEQNSIYVLVDAENTKDKIHSINTQMLDREKDLSTITNDYRECLRLPSQITKSMTDRNVNLHYNTETNERYITFNKTEFIIWASKLKSLAETSCKLEKDMSDLKLQLNGLMDAVFVNVTNQTISNNGNENKQQQTITSLTDKKETVNHMEIKSLPCAPTCEDTNILKETTETINLDLLTISETNVDKKNIEILCENDSILESNKENQDIVNLSIDARHTKYKSDTREHCMQLTANTSNNSNVANDSFVTLENELNINIKPNAITELLNLHNHTPLTNKYRKVNGPLKEYMTLKSGMSCLLTPNIRQYPCLKTRNNMNSDTAARLSNKVLADLSKLYSDSPDTQ